MKVLVADDQEFLALTLIRKHGAPRWPRARSSAGLSTQRTHCKGLERTQARSAQGESHGDLLSQEGLCWRRLFANVAIDVLSPVLFESVGALNHSHHPRPFAPQREIFAWTPQLCRRTSY
jgi:hypothetical protein